jgi:hypothetical protein
MLYLYEVHPMLDTIGDSRPDQLLAVEHPCVETEAPMTWDWPVTSTDGRR